ncbi:MAG: SUMF1/EgtB/PvdO family nonheme iron enzyme [Treponema sp.]|nr:SUMF1/EgtB/PvdO family nonheme iron enzyme [Treponema sp.]
MKKVFVAALFALCAVPLFSENWVSELGNCWDAVEANPTLSSRSSFERYSEIAKALKAGKPGLSEVSDEELHSAWISILKDFESYWSSNCPKKITFSNLRKYMGTEVVKVPFTVSVDPEEYNGETTRTIVQEEIRETAKYSVSISSDFTLKYNEILSIVKSGLRVARKSDWTDIPRNWPLESVYSFDSETNPGDACLVSYIGKKIASVAQINGCDFLDISFDVKDSSGHTLFSSGKKIIGTSDVIFEKIDAEKVALADKAIEDGKIIYVPTELLLRYGEPEHVSSYSREWAENLPSKSFSVSSVRFENPYETFHEEKHVIDEEEARIIASEMMVRVQGDGTIGSFEIGKTEVTQRLYKDVMRKNPSNFLNLDKPVETVSFFDAIVFCNRLSEICGKQPVYSVDGKTDCDEWHYVPGAGNTLFGEIEVGGGDGYRLPTEEEWMYAAHGGEAHEEFAYSGRNKEKIAEIAWYKKNAFKTRESGKKEPNSLGLFDMTGNVWEWCFDVHKKDSSKRIAKGGSWSYDERFCKISDIYIRSPNQRFDCLGIRVAALAR